MPFILQKYIPNSTTWETQGRGTMHRVQYVIHVRMETILWQEERHTTYDVEDVKS